MNLAYPYSQTSLPIPSSGDLQKPFGYDPEKTADSTLRKWHLPETPVEKVEQDPLCQSLVKFSTFNGLCDPSKYFNFHFYSEELYAPNASLEALKPEEAAPINEFLSIQNSCLDLSYEAANRMASPDLRKTFAFLTRILESCDPISVKRLETQDFEETMFDPHRGSGCLRMLRVNQLKPQEALANMIYARLWFCSRGYRAQSRYEMSPFIDSGGFSIYGYDRDVHPVLWCDICRLVQLCLSLGSRVVLSEEQLVDLLVMYGAFYFIWFARHLQILNTVEQMVMVCVESLDVPLVKNVVGPALNALLCLFPLFIHRIYDTGTTAGQLFKSDCVAVTAHTYISIPLEPLLELLVHTRVPAGVLALPAPCVDISDQSNRSVCYKGVSVTGPLLQTEVTGDKTTIPLDFLEDDALLGSLQVNCPNGHLMVQGRHALDVIWQCDKLVNATECVAKYDKHRRRTVDSFACVKCNYDICIPCARQSVRKAMGLKLRPRTPRFPRCNLHSSAQTLLVQHPYHMSLWNSSLNLSQMTYTKLIPFLIRRTQHLRRFASARWNEYIPRLMNTSVPPLCWFGRDNTGHPNLYVQVTAMAEIASQNSTLALDMIHFWLQWGMDYLLSQVTRWNVMVVVDEDVELSIHIHNVILQIMQTYRNRLRKVYLVGNSTEEISKSAVFQLVRAKIVTAYSFNAMRNIAPSQQPIFTPLGSIKMPPRLMFRGA